MLSVCLCIQPCPQETQTREHLLYLSKLMHLIHLFPFIVWTATLSLPGSVLSEGDNYVGDALEKRLFLILWPHGSGAQESDQFFYI